ncbi:hypothetical protein [Salimicrobium flavidum]|uniref:Uncharacterized protein n=1 Tax=Salimicrobium flavidum TaxID=570947 RepID=A0A1N7J9W2_9BACI|nr:hypothetical protein [Salimicrobium flavidum]SIS46143.1 hypothetical protein SAMN05421687_104244 [Salimicrobium flavidum]
MAINHRKCTRCGSLNTMPIMYGEPSYEAFLESEQGKFKLGGCMVSPTSPEYHCRECGNEWNREDAVTHAYEQLRGMKAVVGGYPDGNYEVDIDFEERKLVWSHEEESHKIELTSSDIERLLYELKWLNILNWRAEYVEPFSMDGTSWRIEFRRDGRNLKKRGVNDFPEEWKEFCQLMRNMSGKEFR